MDGNGSCFWISAELGLGRDVHPRDAMALIIKAYEDTKTAFAMWDKSEEKIIRKRSSALKNVLHEAGDTLAGLGSHKSPWGRLPGDAKALAVVSNANVHVYDVSLYQTDVPVLGDQIKVQLFTPLLTDANRIIYYHLLRQRGWQEPSLG